MKRFTGRWNYKWIPSVVDWIKLTHTDEAIHEIQKVIKSVPFEVPHNVTWDTCFWGHLLLMVGLPFIADHLLFLSPPGSLPRSPTLISPNCLHLHPKSQLFPLLGSVSRDLRYFCSPDAFYPQHFLDEQGYFRKTEAFVSFLYSRFLWSNFPQRNMSEPFPKQWHTFGVQVSMGS